MSNSIKHEDLKVNHLQASSLAHQWNLQYPLPSDLEVKKECEEWSEAEIQILLRSTPAPAPVPNPDTRLRYNLRPLRHRIPGVPVPVAVAVPPDANMDASPEDTEDAQETRKKKRTRRRYDPLAHPSNPKREQPMRKAKEGRPQGYYHG